MKDLIRIVCILAPILVLNQAFGQNESTGTWQMLVKNAGVSAMHLALMHNDKVLILDRTEAGPSNLTLPNGKCIPDPSNSTKLDCWAHSVEFDIARNSIRPLTIYSDTWCSSGAFLADGKLLQAGGSGNGAQRIRFLNPCQNCDWSESSISLAAPRWYASEQILPDNRVIIVGGKGQFNYEFVPKQSGESVHNLPFLAETTDAWLNNLYPFLHLSSDGNLFIFANTKSILLDYKNNRVVKTYPTMPGLEARNYPSSGSSVMLPLEEKSNFQEVEILICGGAAPRSYREASTGNFLPASQNCGRIKITDSNPSWKMEAMPYPRTMGDMVILPTGDVLIINGAQTGTAGWGFARNPALYPLLYKPNEKIYSRFQLMSPASIARPRMYHSTAVLLPDGRILVAGSNTYPRYQFFTPLFPTDVSLEAFSPPYLDQDYASRRPVITHISSSAIAYASRFTVNFKLQGWFEEHYLELNLVAPSFASHSFSMNQRMLKLWTGTVSGQEPYYELQSQAPPHAIAAPAGYYLLYVVHGGLPSSGLWIRLY